MQHYPNNEPFGDTFYKKRRDKPDELRMRFSPQLCYQRYMTVQEVITKFNERIPITSVAEFGCNCFGFLCRNLLHCDFLSTIHQIDIDRERLLIGSFSIFIERERRSYVRKNRLPLMVHLLHGSITEKDDRVLNSDVVIGIELIEHLEPDDFNKFPEVVFDFMKPKLVILTTPNHDFNELFPTCNTFRHEDHKFEFSRKEFADWADSIIRKYPEYSVELHGIGEPPDGSPDVGCCSQMAIFERSEFVEEQKVTEPLHNYELMGSYEYFNFNKHLSMEAQIQEVVESTCFRFWNDRYTIELPNEECEYHPIVVLPLKLVADHNDLCSNIDRLIAINESHAARHAIKFINDVPYFLLEECNCAYENRLFLNFEK